MAYGEMRRIPPQMGLYAAIANLSVSIFGMSTPSSAAILAARVTPIAGGDRRNTHDFGGRSRDERDFFF